MALYIKVSRNPITIEKQESDISPGDEYILCNTLTDETILPPGCITFNDKYAYIGCDDWSLIREYRNKLLSESDYIILLAMETGTPVNNNWVTYRQSLRDIPQTYENNPYDIVWPIKPQ